MYSDMFLISVSERKTIGGPDMLHNDFNTVMLMLRDMYLQYEPPINHPLPTRFKLRRLIEEYKDMAVNPDVDEKLLMTRFDFIMRYAEDHQLNKAGHPMDTCHRLMDIERQTYKSFQFALMMNDDTPVTKDMFVPLKSLPDVSAVCVELKGIRAYGIIDIQVPTNRRELNERMKPLFDHSLVRFLINQHWSFARYNALLSRCVLL